MKTPLILFAEESFGVGKIDSEFAYEEEAARSIGFPTAMYDHEAAQSGDAIGALIRLPHFGEGQWVILRGWMVPGEAYADLHSALTAQGYVLVTSPADYEQAHYIPMAYPQTEGHTPKTAWIEGDDPDGA